MTILDQKRLAHLKLETARQLDVSDGGHIAAASGLVRVGDWFWVAADDELHLGRFNAHHGERIRVFPGELPVDPTERKAQKPDLEAIIYLDRRQSGLKHDALLALGSGATTSRYRGALLPVNPAGEPCGEPQNVDLSPVYQHLATKIPELNIEGAAISGNVLKLAHRGLGDSALIDVDLEQVAQLLRHDRPIAAKTVMHIRPLALGDLNGTPLGVTDIATLADGRLVFTAAAEATTNSYDDGAIHGSVIGVIDKAGTVVHAATVAPITKLEGVCVLADGRSAIDLAVVCDQDDPSTAATLYRTTLHLQ